MATNSDMFDERLESCTLQNTADFSLVGKQTVGRVLDVYDGDTLTIAMPMLGAIYQMSCRLEGIDTCEMKSHTDYCKNMAYRARNRLLQLCASIATGSAEDVVPFDNRWKRKQVQQFLQATPYYVRVLCGEFDKYGRLLVSIGNFARESNTAMYRNFAHQLISERLAYVYTGNTKLTEEQIQQRLTSSDFLPTGL